jgi:Ca-activated chloride channel homolog
VSAAAAFLLLAGPGVQVSLAHRQPVFPTEIGTVVLRATVKNERGELVTNLDRAAFTVYENGQPQTVTAFSRDDVPVSLGILLDHSRSMRRAHARMLAAALTLARASKPRDGVFVLNFADKATIDVPFANDVEALERGIGRADYVGGTALRDAILWGEAYLAEDAGRERKALVVVSDGCDNASAASREEVKERARRSQIVLHAIGLLNEDDSGQADRGRKELDELCEESGGLAYFPRAIEDVGPMALDLAHQIRNQYTIGYSPANQSFDGSYRRIRVVAKGPGRLTVRARAGYRAVPSERQGRETASARQEQSAIKESGR